MSIRLRRVNGRLIAICAARSVEKPGDVYLDDEQHHALTGKFSEDFASEGYNTQVLDREDAALRAQEESNNPARDWWDSVYVPEGLCTACSTEPCAEHAEGTSET